MTTGFFNRLQRKEKKNYLMDVAIAINCSNIIMYKAGSFFAVLLLF